MRGGEELRLKELSYGFDPFSSDFLQGGILVC